MFQQILKGVHGNNKSCVTHEVQVYNQLVLPNCYIICGRRLVTFSHNFFCFQKLPLRSNLQRNAVAKTGMRYGQMLTLSLKGDVARVTYVLMSGV